jgi:DNA-binding transcriptional LysR family regulator
MSAEITIRQLKYFAAAAESGQFSMAAATQHVSQSAITNAVIALERMLGTRLFDRLPHGVTLTHDGHDFYHQARHVIDSLQDAMHKSRSKARDAEGVVRIGASYTVMGYFLPEMIARFRASYPNIIFELHDMSRPTIEEAVLEDQIDVGVVLLSNVTNVNRFGHRSLIRSQRVLWVAPSHPLAQLRRPTLKDVSAHPYIMLTVDEGEQSTQRYWETKKLHPNVVLRTSSMEALRGFVAYGFGVTILSEMVFRPWSLEGKRIEARSISPGVPQMDVGTIWRKDTSLSGTANTFLDFLTYAR